MAKRVGNEKDPRELLFAERSNGKWQCRRSRNTQLAEGMESNWKTLALVREGFLEDSEGTRRLVGQPEKRESSNKTRNSFPRVSGVISRRPTFNLVFGD